MCRSRTASSPAGFNSSDGNNRLQEDLMTRCNNQVSSEVRRVLILSAMTAAAATGAPAMAADAAPEATEAPIQEVVVTGSRIQSPNVTSISPVTTVSAADITATGLTR